MKKQEIISLVKLLLAPVLVILLGLILIINPDSATALISKALGTVIILVGVGFGISAVFEKKGRAAKSIAAVVLAITGGWLVNNPLALAAWIGRIIGILLIIDGVQDIGELRKCGMTFRMPLLVTVIGAVLLLVPMTTSRLVFALIGVVVLVVGVAMLLDRLKGKKRLNQPKNPDIIDAE